MDELCSRIRRLPKRQLWRYGQAGDLPARTGEIEQLARANGRRPVMCYTHHRNFDAIGRANELGFHINISADNFDEADSFARRASGFMFQGLGHWQGFLILAATSLIAAGFLWITMPDKAA